MRFHFNLTKFFRFSGKGYIYFEALLFILFGVACSTNDTVSSLQSVNPEKVDFIAIYGDDSLEITRNEQDWLLNGVWPADPAAVDNFFYALHNLEITGATSGENLDSIMSRKILIREKNRLKKLRFYSANNLYLIHNEGSKRMYRVQLKTNPDANLSHIFSGKVSDWQNRKILNFKADNINEILALPGSEYGQGFLLKVTGDSLSLHDPESLKPITENPDPEKLILYLSYFGEIYFDEEILTDSIKLRIYDSHPFFRFVVKNSDKNTVDFSIYPLYIHNGEKDVFFGAMKFTEDDRLFKVNYVFLDLLFQDLSYFIVE